MKRNKMCVIILLVLIVGLSISCFSKVSAGFESPKTSAIDTDYVFERDVLYESNSPVYDNLFNVVNKTRYTGEYNATYDFFEDSVGAKDMDIGIVDEIVGTNVCTIVEGYGLHKNVLRFNSSAKFDLFKNYIDDKSSGIVEYWVKWISGRTAMQFGHGGEQIIIIEIFETYAKIHYSSTFINVDVADIYRVKFEFDCATDKISVWISDVLILDNENFYLDRNLDHIDYFKFQLNDFNSEILLDSIDYNWTAGYVEGRNRFSLTETDTSIQEVDRCEFALEGINDFNDLGLNNPNGWDYVGDGTDVNVVVDYSDMARDRTVEFHAIGNENSGLENTFSYTGHTRLNVTFGFNLTQWNVDDGYLEFHVYSYDISEVMSVYVTRVGGAYKLYSYKLGGTVYIYPYINLNDFYDLNIYIDYNLNMSVIRLKENGVQVTQFAYDVPLLASDSSTKEGIGQVECYIDGVVGNVIKTEIDYIGVYCDFEPKNLEYGFMEKQFDGVNWDSIRNNLFIIEARGYYALYKYWDESKNLYEVEDVSLETIDSLIYHYASEGENVYNLYDNVNKTEYGSYLTYFKGFYDLTSISVEGVKLVEGNNSYPLQFLHGGVNIDESYFYVSGNSLRWTMTCNDSAAEYITANFDIENIACENSSFRFASDTDGGGYADLQVFYSDYSSDYHSILYYYRSITVILPQTKFIERFTLYIYDNDEFNSSLYTGYIKEFSLYESCNIVLSIGIIDLVGIMIPLLIMIVPPLAVSRKFGNKAIMPMFVLMAVICFITALIPAWLFFVIAFGLIVFIFMKKKKDVVK